MELKSILDEKIIVTDLRGNSKSEILRNLSELLLKNKYIKDIDLFLEAIQERENEGPTGMGSGISIPHGKSTSAIRNGIAIAKLENEIIWESSMSDSGFQKTNFVFLFCVTSNEEFATTHMRLLAELAGRLGNNSRLKKLQQINSKHEIISALIGDVEECDDSDENVEIIDLEFSSMM